MTVRPKTIKLQEENFGCEPLGVGLDDDFLDVTPKAKATKVKINKCDYSKLKSFYTEK